MPFGPRQGRPRSALRRKGAHLPDLTPSAPLPTKTTDAPPPHVRLFDLLGDGRLTVATAESCTGGGVAHRITGVSGSSAYFLGGIVSYSNSAKAALLGVSESILANPGAVSEPCAAAMAEGARRAFGADVSVATTGIAGPNGGTARKPVGLVYIATSSPAGTHVTEHHFPGDRQAVIDAATIEAMRLLVAAVEAALGAEGRRADAPAAPDS